MKKKLLIAVMALSLSSCQFVLADSPANEQTELGTESTEEELDPVSHIYTFSLNGDTYTLPCAVTEFTENGWNLGSGKLDANTYARTIGYYNGGTQSVAFEVLNNTEENGVDLSELLVVAVKVTQNFTDVEGYEFETADGICPGMTIDEVKELYGEPASENSSYICYRFQERYEPGTGELRGLGDVYAGEDALYVYKADDSDIIERVDLQFYGFETEEDAE